MEYVKVINGTATSYSIEQLLSDNPKTSFPKTFPAEMLAEYDVFIAVKTDGADKVSDGFERVDGQWRTKWRDKTPQEVSDAVVERRNRTRVPLHAFRLALIENDHIAAVRTFIQTLSGKQRARLEARIEYQRVIGRSESWVNQLLTSSGLTEEQIDAVFDAAQEI